MPLHDARGSETRLFPMIQNDLRGLAYPIDDLNLLPGNPRRGNVEAVARSLEAFGQRKPVVARRSDRVVIAGNHTLQAARSLGWVEVAVVWVDDDETMSKAFALADNRTAELGDYDQQALADLIQDVGSVDPELLVASGWSDEAVAELVAALEPEVLPVVGDVDEVPVEVVAKSVPGDVWLLGLHRVMCGDSTSPTDLERLMSGVIPEMVFADPPYGISHSGKGISSLAKNGKVIKGNNFGEIMGDGDVQVAVNAFTTCSLQYPNASMIWWGANYYPSALPNGHGWIVWDKERVGDVFSGAELAFVNGGVRVDVFRHMWHGIAKASEVGEKRVHPTQKPVALAKWCFDAHGNPKTILDPFGGSGSTLIAAHQSNRVAYLMELDPKYVDVICARFQKVTGIKPVAEATGREHDFLNA